MVIFQYNLYIFVWKTNATCEAMMHRRTNKELQQMNRLGTVSRKTSGFKPVSLLSPDAAAPDIKTIETEKKKQKKNRNQVKWAAIE